MIKITPQVLHLIGVKLYLRGDDVNTSTVLDAMRRSTSFSGAWEFLSDLISLSQVHFATYYDIRMMCILLLPHLFP